MKVRGQIVDVLNRRIFPGCINISGNIIDSITEEKSAPAQYILPGLIDAHIHIESSMVTPGSFAQAAVSRGTTAVISDPHEIANVLGIKGIRFMISDASTVPLKFFFGAPSCVPATSFESSGAIINSDDILELLSMPEIKYLAEMMNYPGVILNDREVEKKLSIARQFNKPVDGHAPGLTGESLRKYVSAGITTDHECTTLKEAKEKISLGMKILIREGSASGNLDDLKDLYKTNPDMVMLCSDDLHPEMLVKQHINKHVAKLISEGFDIFDVVKSCTLNPAVHYNLGTGSLQPGFPADLIITDDYKKMNIAETWIDGKKIYEKGRVLFEYKCEVNLNNFNSSQINSAEIKVSSTAGKLRVIEAFDGDLRTRESIVQINQRGHIEPDIKTDILKIIVKDRYGDLPPAIGFIRGFGLKSGAFASSVAHDSHNIICIGTNNNDIISAVDEIVRMKGGLSVVNNGKIDSLPLPVAGIMSDKSPEFVASKYQALSEKVRSMGCTISSPFMTMSFMALLVIPELKLGDKGLFDGNNFCFVPLFFD
jgi:adenine deaminase